MYIDCIEVFFFVILYFLLVYDYVKDAIGVGFSLTCFAVKLVVTYSNVIGGKT